jgi:HlyD family secretion protein
MAKRIIPLLVLLPALAWLLVACTGERPVNPSGTFEATEVDLSPLISGQVLRVGPRLGDHVQKGDTLVVIDTELIELERDQARANLAAAAARRRVAQDQRDEAQRSLTLAELTLQRIESQAAAGNATQQALDETVAQRDLAAVQVRAAENAVAALDAEQRATEARIAVTERRQKDGILLAPLDGTVLLRAVEPGEVAQPGRLCLRLADLSRLELRVYLQEAQLGLVAIGREVRVNVDALPDRSFTGIVTWISDEAEFTPKNAQTRTARAQLVYAVKLAVDNPGHELHIGMPAEAAF